MLSVPEDAVLHAVPSLGRETEASGTAAANRWKTKTQHLAEPQEEKRWKRKKVPLECVWNSVERFFKRINQSNSARALGAPFSS